MKARPLVDPVHNPRSGAAAGRRTGREEYFYLFYLVYLFAQPVFTGGWLQWLVAIAILALFLPLYFRASRVQLQGEAGPGWLMALLAFAASFYNPGASVLYVYAASSLAFALPRKQAVRVFLLMSLVALVQTAVTVLLWQSWFTVIPFAFALIFIQVVGFANIADRERRLSAERLQLAHDEIEQLATIAERERIARDMHDVLGHSLSVVILKSELAVRLAELDPQRSVAEMRDVERLAREALQEVRAAIAGYRSSGLTGELANAAMALDAAGVALQQDMAGELQALPLLLETTLALVLREAVTNVIRHACARVCSVSLQRLDSGGRQLVRLEISDDGRGSRNGEGNGLRGMRQRVAALGGSLEHEGHSGTRLTVTLPLEPA
jgi:two-component system sensor histidine kinase DesK